MPTPSLTETDLGAPPSTLHARLEELARWIVQTKIPSGIWQVLPQAGRIAQLLAPVLGRLHIAPETLASLPCTPAELQMLLTRELRSKSPAELQAWLANIGESVDAWLIEYHESIHPISEVPEVPDVAAEGAAPSVAPAPEATDVAPAEESPADGCSPLHDAADVPAAPLG